MHFAVATLSRMLSIAMRKTMSLVLYHNSLSCSSSEISAEVNYPSVESSLKKGQKILP